MSFYTCVNSDVSEHRVGKFIRLLPFLRKISCFSHKLGKDGLHSLQSLYLMLTSTSFYK